MKRLIVNADDFGRTPGVNRGIAQAHDRGIVTSATLMVAHPAAAEAATLARARAGLGVGLHVALTGGSPVMPPAQVPTLVDESGRLPAKAEGLQRAHPRELLAEMRAQLRLFRELMGRLPTHFDSHHHVHAQPAVLEALMTLSWETGRPVRSASPQVRERLRSEAIPTNDAFIDGFFDAGASLESLIALLGRVGPGVTELMCHPAVVDDELRASSGYAEPRARELEVLTHADARATLQALGIQLSNYETL
ncbi:MAG TPA: ChbG/HpnK family deacetylase [Vicinamibacteria bacterium]|nr:ChbG/HpnK family deacetylase [Vicinamibacteria bacterium]